MPKTLTSHSEQPYTVPSFSIVILTKRPVLPASTASLSFSIGAPPAAPGVAPLRS